LRSLYCSQCVCGARADCAACVGCARNDVDVHTASPTAMSHDARASTRAFAVREILVRNVTSLTRR
jgi:hypothetical protein